MQAAAQSPEDDIDMNHPSSTLVVGFVSVGLIITACCVCALIKQRCNRRLPENDTENVDYQRIAPG